ncbi:hypothetical protein [Pedobacter frigoris]|uniref:DUF4157 domain-containing protein n=1 Tax=Pedobacter frigoris TaxID=2571272 RepID=A0A4U1CD60_9SPHI|nr:hypothetical protein [Pedobacter frigoris]TKC04884.1 hypothetical protein FA047_14015 [Pedobacter frigoris]
MRPLFLIFPKLPASGMAIFPFILIKDRRFKLDPILVNHERIHFRQQLELLILPFFLLYFFHYLINLLRYKNHYLAYFNICFEKEAYTHDRNLAYLTERKLFSWVRFLGKKD